MLCDDDFPRKRQVCWINFCFNQLEMTREIERGEVVPLTPAHFDSPNSNEIVLAFWLRS